MALAAWTRPGAIALVGACLSCQWLPGEAQLRRPSGDAAELGQERTPHERRLGYNPAIDACPQYWTDYFAPQALELICPCMMVTETQQFVEGPATTYDLIRQQKACPTTTAKSVMVTPGPTTTTLEETTITTSRTTTSTTKYCEACDALTAGPTTGTSTTTLTSITVTSTTTTSATTSTSTEGTTGKFTTTSTQTVTETTTRTETVTTTTSPTPPPGTVTSTTSTKTTVTKTTTILLPCSICPLYHFLCPDGCTNCVAPGMCRTVYHKQEVMFDLACDHRRALQPADSCVDFAYVQVSCPAGNMFPGRKVVEDNGAYPSLKCRTCGLAPIPADSNPLRGHWAGKVSWGPNQYMGVISETEIHSYKLYVTDAMYQKLGEPLHVEEVQLWATMNAACCDTEFYSASLDFMLPENYTYFMVVPLTIAGLELNVGVISERIRDLGAALAIPSAGRRAAACLWQSLLSSSVLIALLLSSALAR